MLNVFVISSDKRVESLITHFQPFFKTKIRRASDFDHGLKEVFENRPSMVFIQSTIDSVSGETVARHIKSLLGSESPKIIFMDETPGSEKKSASWCDATLVISDSEKQFQEDFAALVSLYNPTYWSGIAGEKKAESSLEAADGSGAGPENTETVTAQEGHEAPGRGNSAALRETPLGAETFPVSTSSASGADIDKAASAKAVASRDNPSPGEDLPPSIAYQPAERKAGRYLAILTVLIVLLAAGSFLYLKRSGLVGGGEVTKTPVSVDKGAEKGATAVSSVEKKKGIVALPSFVLSETRDNSFSEGRPGWERYLLPDYEIRVFKENGVIRALQVIARKDAGVPDPFLQSFLKELGYAGPVPRGTEKRKDGFLVKSVMLDGFGELVTYRRDGEARLTAFVLEFS
jgi:flagellar FliL protein